MFIRLWLVSWQDCCQTNAFDCTLTFWKVEIDIQIIDIWKMNYCSVILEQLKTYFVFSLSNYDILCCILQPIQNISLLDGRSSWSCTHSTQNSTVGGSGWVRRKQKMCPIMKPLSSSWTSSKPKTLFINRMDNIEWSTAVLSLVKSVLVANNKMHPDLILDRRLD